MLINRFVTPIVLLTLLLTYRGASAQDVVFSKSSVKLGFGLGLSMGYNTYGLGLQYNIGYQREIWNDRFRLNPNFSIGHYSSAFLLDARDEYFNSINFATNLYYDVIRIKSFSLVLGTGVLVNNSKGLIGTGGNRDDNDTLAQSSEFVNDVHLAAHLGAGFRINHPNQRTSMNILPINLLIGTRYFVEFHPKFEVDIKF